MEIVGPLSQATYYVKVPEGSKLPDAVVEAARRIGIRFAMVAAIGGLEYAKIAVYEAKTSTYHYVEVKPLEGYVLETVSLQGNIACFASKCYPHLHVLVARKPGELYAGHLLEARVKPFLELFITSLPAGEETLARLFQHRTKQPVILPLGQPQP